MFTDISLLFISFYELSNKRKKFNDMFHRNSGRMPPHGMSRADAISQTVAEYSNMPVHIKHSTLILPIEFGKHYPGSQDSPSSLVGCLHIKPGRGPTVSNSDL